MHLANIVVGIDFSPASRKALETAGFLAGISGAKVTIVHAFQPAATTKLAGAPRRTAAKAVGRAEVEEASNLTTKWAEPLRKQGIDVEVICMEGKPADLLLKGARRAALLVVGTTGKGLVRTAFLGSTSQALLRKAAIPLLLLPDRAKAPNGPPGPVVAGIDLGAGSGGVLAAAAALARDLGAGLHALHSIELPVPVSVPEMGWSAAAVLTPEMMERDEVGAVEAVTELSEKFRRDLPIHNYVYTGEPATSLLVHAKQAGASCVVVGRRRTKRTGLGSVSRTVVQRADRPVLVVPA